MPEEGTQPAQEAATTPEATATTEPQATEPKSFDEGYVKKLRDEAAGYRKRAQEAEARNQEHEEANKTELERATSKATKAEQRAAEAEARLLRYEVATDKQVPAKLVPLLTATTREALEAQAALILESAKPAAPDFDGGPREPAPEPKKPEQAHNDAVLTAIGLLNPNR